jgi:DMSO reductase anchor subunit
VAAPATAATTPVSSAITVPAWYSGIPAAGYVIIPLVLGLAYLLMLALGPDAQPAAGPAQNGVARALERLRTAGASIASRGKN